MNYAQIRPYDIANGIGIRSTLFVAGCTRNCPGCFNQDYQDFNYGMPWDDLTEDTFISYINRPQVYGASILGGEPMDQDKQLVHLLERIRIETKKDIWIYSGYVFEDIIKDPIKRRILMCCDVLIDGPFIEAYKDISLPYRGSKNQRIINIPASLNLNQVVLLDLTSQ